MRGLVRGLRQPHDHPQAALGAWRQPHLTAVRPHDRDDDGKAQPDAVDIGPWAGAEWLGRRGAAFGLCQIYVNEAWHFEYRPEAATQGCPRMYLDPTQDPRMAGE